MKGGSLPKNYSDEGGGGHAKKIGNWGVIQFSNYTPPNPTSPPYPVKNERSLGSFINSTGHDDDDGLSSRAPKEKSFVQLFFIL